MKQTWIQKVQTSNEAVKRAWLYGLTSLSMVAVVALWVGYMTISVPAVSQPENFAAKVGVQDSSAFVVLKAGLEKVAGFAGVRLNRGLALMKDLLLPESTITISKQPTNFVLEGLPPLARRPLVE